MASNCNFANQAFASEETPQRDQTEDDLQLNIETTESLSSKSSCRNKKNHDDHDVKTSGRFCGIWSSVEGTSRLFYRQRGLLLAICSAFCFSVKAMFLEILTKTMHPFQIAVMIMPMLILGPLLYLTYKRIPVPKGCILYRWLLLSGIGLSAYLSLFTLSISKMNVADAVTIAYTSIVFVGILSWIFLKETPTLYYVMFSLLSFLGVVFIARPPFIFGNELGKSKAFDLLMGTGFALGAALSIGVVLTAVRKQTKLSIHTTISMLCNALMVVLTNVIFCTATRSWNAPSTSDFLCATGAGSSYFFGQLTLYLALKFETATFVNIVIIIEIVFTFLWQFSFLHIHPVWTSYVGASFVVAACIGMTLKEKRQTPAIGGDNTPHEGLGVTTSEGKSYIAS